jgi:hypothetical protein
MRYKEIIRGYAFHTAREQIHALIHTLPAGCHLLLPNSLIFNQWILDARSSRPDITVQQVDVPTIMVPTKLEFLARAASHLTIFTSPGEPARTLSPFDLALIAAMQANHKTVDIIPTHRRPREIQPTFATRIQTAYTTAERKITADLANYPTPPQVVAVLGPAKGIQTLDSLLERFVADLPGNTYVLLGSSLTFDRKIAELLHKYQILCYRFANISGRKLLWHHELSHLIQHTQKVAIFSPLRTLDQPLPQRQERQTSAARAREAGIPVEIIPFIPDPSPRRHATPHLRWKRKYLFPPIEALLKRHNLAFTTYHNLHLYHVDYIVYDAHFERYALINTLAHPDHDAVQQAIHQLEQYADYHQATQDPAQPIHLDLALAMPQIDYPDTILQLLVDHAINLIPIPCPAEALHMVGITPAPPHSHASN